MTLKHITVPDWTQAELDSVIAGNSPPLPPAGTLLSGVCLPSDWNGLQGVFDTKADTSSLGTAAYEDVTYFADAAQGALADTALQTVSVDGVTITGDGTPGDPLISVGGTNIYNSDGVITDNAQRLVGIYDYSTSLKFLAQNVLGDTGQASILISNDDPQLTLLTEASDGQYSQFYMYNGQAYFQDGRTVPVGIQYTGDYSSTFTGDSLVTKTYVDSHAGPAGSPTNMQFYDPSGGFGGADVNYLKSSHRTGFQIDTPLATIHAGATHGDTIDPPTSMVLQYTLDPSVDSPASASATVVNAPVDPSYQTIGFTYIDQPTDAGWFANQNTGETGFIANGQTLNWSVYTARYVGGVPVVNPVAFTSITFTDTINDGTTPFGVDIGGWQAPNGYVDTFILSRYDNQTGLTEWIDLGNTTSYADQGFTGTNNTQTSVYASSGSSWSSGVAQYLNAGFVPYRSAYTSNTNTDANISGAYLILNVSSWGSLTNDGFIVQHNNGYFFDIATANSYDDYGQTSGSVADYPTFASVAFPYFNTALTPCSGTSAPGGFQYGSGNFIADGSTWAIYIQEYRINSIDGLKYFAPADSIGLGVDDSSFSSFYLSWSTTIGDGDGRYVTVYQNGTPVYEEDISGATSTGDLYGATSSIVSKPAISGYSGINWAWSNYGYITAPSLKYSSTPKTYTANDGNPYGGYLWKHDQSSFGTATSMKVIETAPPYRSTGNFYDGGIASTVYQTYVALGNSTVTPNTVGFLGDGTTYYYDIYSYSSAYAIYSSTALSDDITLPNDGLHYIINDSYTASASATSYKARRASMRINICLSN